MKNARLYIESVKRNGNGRLESFSITDETKKVIMTVRIKTEKNNEYSVKYFYSFYGMSRKIISTIMGVVFKPNILLFIGDDIKLSYDNNIIAPAVEKLIGVKESKLWDFSREERVEGKMRKIYTFNKTKANNFLESIMIPKAL